MALPCRIHRCSKCCHGTEMRLTRDDIERIKRHGFDDKEFVVNVEGYKQLRNRDGRCVFLKGDDCSIYPSRPKGCRLYPLIYDCSKGKVVLDEFCPYRHEFSFGRLRGERVARLIKSIEEERGLRNLFKGLE